MDDIAMDEYGKDNLARDDFADDVEETTFINDDTPPLLSID